MNLIDPDWILPAWPAPRSVHALITTRGGGVSSGRYAAADGAGGMNLGFGSQDSIAAVSENRARLRAVVPSEPRWLMQVHGAVVVDAQAVVDPMQADAAFTSEPGVVTAVLVADCLPVLLTDAEASCVGVAHAGWRGMAAGVIQNTAAAMRRRIGRADAELLAYLGPCIGPAHFEVGAEVLAAMGQRLPDAGAAFVPNGSGKFLADLAALARQALSQAGVEAVFGAADCTFSEPARFYSFRRDRVTGRHAALIWLS